MEGSEPSSPVTLTPRSATDCSPSGTASAVPAVISSNVPAYRISTTKTSGPEGLPSAGLSP